MTQPQNPSLSIKCTYRGKTLLFKTEKVKVLLGRSSPTEPVDVDLSPDRKVSRHHAIIGRDGGQFWIEDLDSSRGTQVSGSEIKGKGKCPLRMTDTIQIGDTTLTFAGPVTAAGLREYGELPERPAYGQSLAATDPRLEIAGTLDANATVFATFEGKARKPGHILEALYELPLQFAAETRLDTLLPTIVSRLAELIPQAASISLLLKDSDRDALLLKAYQARSRPSVSETLARRAMTDRKAFIWKRSLEGDISGSILQERIETGMYAPLLWQGEALGALCADNPNVDASFTEDALRLMVVVAQYAAMAVAGHQLQEKLRRESATRSNLMRQFSPRVAERLLAHRGRLRLGGERCEATILCSDIRGFTKLASSMEPDDTVEMLNEYFGHLVPLVFAHQGTVDKYIGDAILAIFGSPEPDPDHHEHGVRAALEMQAAVAKLNATRQARGAPTREIGIGIHCGEVVHGFIGTADRMEFTVVSDAVNRASRYCEGAAGGEVLISPEMHEHVWKILESERITIPTKHEGDFLAYRVKHLKKERA